MADEGVPVAPTVKRRGLLGLGHRLVAWRLPGLPPELGTIQWLFAASLRMTAATGAALVTAWTGVIVALWIGALSAIGSIVVTAFGIAVSGHAAGVLSFTSNTSGGVVFLSALIAGAIGFGTGFAATYTSSLLAGFTIAAAAVCVGIIIGLIFGFIWLCMERHILGWRGYRQPSRRERDLYLDTAVRTVCENMGITGVPWLLIMDTPIPQAWTYARTIVLSKGLLEGLDAAELAGVLAHEVTHWRNGDGLALRMVTYFAWPVAICYSIGMVLSGSRSGAPVSGASETPHSSGQSTMRGAVSFLSFFGWMLLWPSYLLTKFVVVPVMAGESRYIEYQADAGAKAAGLGGGLQRALEQLSAFEIPQNAWDAALTSTHPPTELRIEALEEGSTLHVNVADTVQEVSGRQAGEIIAVFIVLAFVAASPHIRAIIPHTHGNWWW